MTSLGRSAKTSSYLTGGRRRRRPTTLRRTASSSSEFSTTSTDSISEDQFVLSTGNTPTAENPPTLAAGLSATTAPVGAPLTNSTSAKAIQTPDSPPRLHRSLPIAIEQPALRKANAGPVYTPTAPLSARGDIQGAYFPLHEDPKLRVYRPHPFSSNAKETRHRSSPQADRPEPLSQRPDRIPAPGLAMSEPTRLPTRETTGEADPRDHRDPAQITSYMPTGAHDSPLPMGKYYPSNYERRSPTNTQHHRPPPAAAHAKSDPQTAKPRKDSPYSRLDSGARHRLQQYQRDMIAQAALAASEVLGASANRGGPSSSALEGLPLMNIQLGGSMMRGHKPVSPRLLPLGSPGPVTPIDLEGGGDSYLTRGDVVAGLEAAREQKDVNLSVRVEEDRRLRGAVTPPVPTH